VNYKVEFTAQATDDLTRLDRTVAQRIIQKIGWFSENLQELVPEPLGGALKGLFKLRVGDYRAIYSLNQQQRLIVVHLIGHRRDIYTLPL